MNIFLKVKVSTLAAEARIIRNLERSRQKQFIKAKERGVVQHGAHDDKTRSLYLHRVQLLRPTIRANHLAYGFLRGREYGQMEQFAYTEPNWKEIEKVVTRFASGDERDVQQSLAEWLEAAKKVRKQHVKEIRKRAVKEAA